MEVEALNDDDFVVVVDVPFEVECFWGEVACRIIANSLSPNSTATADADDVRCFEAFETNADKLNCCFGYSLGAAID